MQQIVIHGNNIELLKNYPDNYFDSVVTDAPYGLGKEPNAEALMKDWIEKGYHEIQGSGFMGKEWDAFIPQPIFWNEVFRVLKHGGHVLSFFGTRTYDWGVMSMRFAGFEVRDCIQWLYGSGFPKSHNIGKAIDKIEGNEREVISIKPNHKKGMDFKYENDNGGWLANDEIIETKGNSDWEGWGTALKPANEPIVLARKPLEKGLSIAENILKWGVGGINIDASRISTNGETWERDNNVEYRIKNNIPSTKSMLSNGNGAFVNSNPQGRFPANLILTHHPECECVGTKKVGKGERKQHEDGEVSSANEGYKRPNKSSFTHKNSDVIASYGEETIEDWICVDDCPIKILDEQSGESSCTRIGNDNTLKKGKDNVMFGGAKQNNKEIESHHYRDKGGASRFFYIAKASKSERNKGLEGFDAKQMAWSNQAKAELKRGNIEFADDTKMHNKVQERVNFHPTVKPIKLMQYLVRLVTPPNGIVLDPFVGSGTTGIACKLEGFNFVGLEQDIEYCKIAEARIKNYANEPDENIRIVENNKIEKTETQLSLF